MALLDDLTATIANMQTHATAIVASVNAITGIVGPTPTLTTQVTALNAANDLLKQSASSVGIQAGVVQNPVPD